MYFDSNFIAFLSRDKPTLVWVMSQRRICDKLYLESISDNGPLTRYTKLPVAHAPGMPGTFFPTPTSKEPLVRDPGMHHGTCFMYVPWCMLGSLTRGGRENVPGIPGACANRNFTYLVRGPWDKLQFFHSKSKWLTAANTFAKYSVHCFVITTYFIFHNTM